MNEPVIDPTTGLPELPEGYAWRVTESDHATGIRFGYRNFAPAYRLDVVSVEEVEERNVTKKCNPRYRWMTRNTEPEELEHVEITTEQRVRFAVGKRIVRIKDLKELSDSEVLDLCARLTTRFDRKYEPVDLMVDVDNWTTYESMPDHMTELMDFSLTDGSILETSYAVYASFQDYLKREAEKKADEERAKRLVGLYPPNTLKAA